MSWLDAIWNLPVFRWLSGMQFPLTPPDPPEVATAGPVMPPCSVESLPPITDASALAFEAKSGIGPVVDLEGLTPRTNSALTRFQRLVALHRGSMMLTSAYRPEAYQEHLSDVWHKWMDELRDNAEPACADLKTQVGQEFVRHQLLPSQHPVPVSDHTLGIGFDAAVQLPLTATRARRRLRVSLDRIARLAGMMRPDIRRDPVHFRLIGGRA